MVVLLGSVIVFQVIFFLSIHNKTTQKVNKRGYGTLFVIYMYFKVIWLKENIFVRIYLFQIATKSTNII